MWFLHTTQLRVIATETKEEIVRIKQFLIKKNDDIFNIFDQIKVYRIPL